MKLTRRGRLVIALVIVAAFYLIIEVSANLWFTESGYCWGSFEKCYQLEEGNK